MSGTAADGTVFGDKVAISANRSISSPGSSQNENVQTSQYNLDDMVITRFNKMTAGLKEAFCKRVKSVFDFKNINLYNKNYDSISIELKIVQNRKTAMERYSFYNDNDTWRLYLVETK